MPETTLINLITGGGGATGVGGAFYAWFQSKANKESIEKIEDKQDSMQREISDHRTYVAEHYTTKAEIKAITQKLDKIYDFILKHTSQ